MINSLFKVTKLKGLRVFNKHQNISINVPLRVFSRKNHWSKCSYFYGASAVPLKPYTIGAVFDDAVRTAPEREYVVSRHENKRYTFADMNSEVDKVCRGLNALGLKRGDRVGVWMPNCTFYFTMIIATARLGLILVNINPAYRSDELKHSLSLVGVKCLITLDAFKTQNYSEILEEVDPDIWKRSPNTPVKSKVLPMLESVIFNTDKRMNGAYNLESFFDLGSNKDYKIPNIQPEEECNILFTSGTTGKPKAAPLNHFGLVNNAHYIMNRLKVDKETSHTFCCPMPLFHVFGLTAGIFLPMLFKSTVYLPSAHFEPKATVDVIVKEKCSIFFGAPTLFLDVLSVYENLPPELQDNNMKIAITGGAPSSPALMTKFKNMFPGAKLMSAFGMTESGPCTFLSFLSDSDERVLSTVGFIQDNVEVKVVDPNGQMVPFGTPGELLIRGYVNMHGYFNDEEKTKETIDSAGWLHTGDQFVLYEDGYGNHVGRIKEMIIRGGENIFPKEIEDFLESHPSISQVQVYGIPDQRMGEEVCASVIVKEGSTVTEADIKAYSKGKIAHFKIPKYIFIEKDGFPKTTSGKVQKYKMAKVALERISS